VIHTLFNHRTRGFRTINIVAFCVLMVMAVVVNLAKAYAGRDVREITRTERTITEEKRRIRLLDAEVAHLEQPERLQRLAEQVLGMKPLSSAREGDLTSVPALVAGQQPAGPVATPVATEASVEEVTGPVVADVDPDAALGAPTELSPAETGQ
jgi:cell division protein FtsL